MNDELKTKSVFLSFIVHRSYFIIFFGIFWPPRASKLRPRLVVA